MQQYAGIYLLQVYMFRVSITPIIRILLLFFSSGPAAYAPDAPQHVGLLCYPLCYPSVFRRSRFHHQSICSSVQPEWPLVAKGGIAWARIMAGNFA